MHFLIFYLPLGLKLEYTPNWRAGFAAFGGGGVFLAAGVGGAAVKVGEDWNANL